MTKQDFRVFTFFILTICLTAIGLVSFVPQSGQVVTLMLTLPSLLLWGIYTVIRKFDGEDI
jgi:uncharacterized membrane protein